MFRDREDAGQQLAAALGKYKGGTDAVVIGIPRGGIVVAYYVAVALGLPLEVLVARKLPTPGNPEAGLGAIAEDGSVYLTPQSSYFTSPTTLKDIMAEQEKVMTARAHKLRSGRPFADIKNKTVILVDDGIAMGSTMLAAIMMCRHRKAGKVVIAVPVAGKEAMAEFSSVADEVVILETPYHYVAVAQAYDEWSDVSDEQALAYVNSN